MTALADSLNVLSIDHNFLVCSFIFFPFIIDNCNYGSLFRKGMKMKILLIFTIIYQKININIIKKICPGNNLPTHSKENTDFPRQKLR